MDASTVTGSGSGSGSASGVSVSFSCNVCLSRFEDNLQQRANNKSEWHVYNLKRHVASLPPISRETYRDQVLVIKEQHATAEAIATSAFQKSCTMCEKAFLNLTAYHNHFKSQGHAQEVKKLEAKGDLPAMERLTLSDNVSKSITAEPTYFASSKCLFCTFDSESLDLNVTHMQKKHGLYIPNQDYLVDLETFIGYLSTIITQFYECLYCGSTKGSAEAARSHMISKGHCNLKPGPGSEYEDFYDVASDLEDEDIDHNTDGDAKAQIPVLDGNELHLPSGRTLGHRSQVRYFQQRTPVRAKSAERKAIKDSEEGEGIEEKASNSKPDRQLVTKSRGEMGMIGVSDHQKRALRAVEKKVLKAEIRAKNDYRAGLERLGNKQQYYRVSTDCVFDLTK